MSTDLYGIRVLELEPRQRRVRLRVFVVYYDVAYEDHQPLPDDASFFARVLSDCRFDFELGPVAEEMGDNATSESFIDANAYRYVERYEQIDARNVPVESYGGFADFYYKRDGRWKDEDQLVQADYDVWVTDAAYLEHLEPGHSWGSTAYMTNADQLRLDEAPDLPDLTRPTTRLAPFAGKPREAGAGEGLAFSGDSRFLAVASQAGEMVVYAVDPAEEVFRAEVAGELFSPFGWTDGNAVWLGTGDGVRAWAIPSGEPVEVAAPGPVSSASGRLWLTGFEFDVELVTGGGETVAAIEVDGDEISAVCFGRDDRELLLVFDSGPIQIRDLETGAIESVPGVGTNHAIARGPDPRYVATTDYTELAIVDVADGRLVRRRGTDRWMPVSVAWSPDGRWLAAGFAGSGDGNGCRVELFRTGEVWEPSAAARPIAASGERAGLRPLIDAFVAAVDRLHTGWSRAIADSLGQCAIALARLGQLDDVAAVLAHIPSEREAVIARARAAPVVAAIDPERGRALLEGAVTGLAEHGDEYLAAEVRPYLATGYDALGERDRAVAMLAEIESGLDDDDDDERWGLARAWVEIGDVDRAERVLDGIPVDWLDGSRRGYVVALVAAGERTRAEALLERAGEAAPELLDGPTDDPSAAELDPARAIAELNRLTEVERIAQAPRVAIACARSGYTVDAAAIVASLPRENFDSPAPATALAALAAAAGRRWPEM